MASLNVTDERNNTTSNELTNQQTEILEYGDIYFFYRPKVRSEQVKSIDNVRLFFMITAPEAIENHVYRLFLIGKKSLPEIRKSEARASERYWARVGGIFENPNELTKELVSDEFRKDDAAHRKISEAGSDSTAPA